jgi:hypothetical protein
MGEERGERMSTPVVLKQWEAPPATPLDEAVWQAWLAKGRARDRQSSATRAKALKSVSIVGLLASAGLWSYLAPYEIGVGCVVAVVAVVMMFTAFRARHYTFAAVFGALAVLYNPVAPLFSYSGGWQRTLLVATAVPFIASLAWRTTRLAHND